MEDDMNAELFTALRREVAKHDPYGSAHDINARAAGLAISGGYEIVAGQVRPIGDRERIAVARTIDPQTVDAIARNFAKPDPDAGDGAQAASFTRRLEAMGFDASKAFSSAAAMDSDDTGLGFKFSDIGVELPDIGGEA